MHTTFLNCRLCIGGELVERRMVVSEDDGKILQETGFIGGDAVDLEGGIIAPGFLELHTNGARGFHFTGFANGNSLTEAEYQNHLQELARWYASRGITGFWATVPSVDRDVYDKILANLTPKDYLNSAALLGAHLEGPYLAPSKKGAHNESFFKNPSHHIKDVYGPDLSSVKLATLAPELTTAAPESDGTNPLIQQLTASGIRVSLGHSDASYAEGLAALKAGATCLTHTLNAMAPLHHRNPGLAGLITLPEHRPDDTGAPASRSPAPPYYTILADGVHLHPAVATLLYRAAPHRAILISDSIELAGLVDGTYPGHAQIPHRQVKAGGKVTIEGTETLVGSCVAVDTCVRNLMEWSGCGVAAAVRCVTENVAKFMGTEDRGFLNEGCRADFVVLSEEGEVLETWIAGRKVWGREGGFVEG